MVASALEFFTSANLLKLIEQADPQYLLIAEKFGVVVDHKTAERLREADTIRRNILERTKPPVPPYEFMSPPPGWSIETHLYITPGERGYVSRRIGVGQYSMTLKQLQKL